MGHSKTEKIYDPVLRFPERISTILDDVWGKVTMEFPLADTILLLMFYGGPDQLIPLASVFGAIIGFLLIFWQTCVAFIKRALRFVGQKLRLFRLK